MSINNQDDSTTELYDAVVIGAGFSGMYMLHSLRQKGFTVRVYEKGDGVGGAWYWSRYPGARCDSESHTYCYTFSEEIYKEWSWSSRYPEQPEILRYLNFVADKLQLREDIQFNTEVKSASYKKDKNRWQIHLNDERKVSAKYFITGVGCLSVNATNIPHFKGLDQFQGEWYHTGAWPHTKVDFTGKRVGVIGNGSSGIQSIPVIAQEAKQLISFQRTPQFAIPAKNHPYDADMVRQYKEKYSETRQKMHHSRAGYPWDNSERSALEDSADERRKVYEEAWENGGFKMSFTYNDLLINETANQTIGDFVRSKIRDKIQDPTVAKKLMPSYFFATKRLVLDTDYYETFNRENVTLVDVKEAPIQEITANSVRTANEEYEVDILVFATGYDGMTGPLLKIDIQGKGGLSLKEKWAEGASVRAYLGVATAGFPNMFMITGPQSPSVASNMPTSIEHHVEWISNCIEYLDKNDVETIEANEHAEEEWSKHCNDLFYRSLYSKTESWYTGANVEGKPPAFLIYLGGVGPYNKKITEIASKDYEGFTLKMTSNQINI
ncbi:flavin-containing monooxygenase [Cytobacillus purgationiresistens]|uniref:Cation diffusion facilitator CzcD-associated flavoprotein CzcO n=1 Tax=Cytobacillus purgationiresistens TaxID=863449 RepID=A0ABU0ABG5_9BACI|nr:NAD(P)/FAD-dependent oxidoreductase [Cytobacillus purgationiresistens]MDQ0268600.1 cation diffusion facilitator CzcD-associated flavoprotein CzcO [Cytobacillus purgationiresistens]